MTDPGHSEEENAGEGVRVSDKRRIDPETYEVREGVAPTSLTDDALAGEEAAARAIEGDVVGPICSACMRNTPTTASGSSVIEK